MNLHQTLHGYEAGHRLLRSSTRLPSDVQRLMLPLTDAAEGHHIGSYFDGYLTGYPLTTIKSYALSRTWSAPEMDRPGCVWTHTLLIPFSDLARLANPSGLRAAFRRPEIGNYDFYGTPASIPDDLPKHQDRLDERLEQLIWHLYSPPFLPALFVTIDQRDEDYVLAVWGQQWPKLRRSLSFSTAGAPTREIAGRPLDIQFLPLDRWGSDRFASERVAVVHPNPSGEPLPDWVLLAGRDVRSTALTPFRAFLWHYGAEAEAPRDAFRLLATIFELLQEPSSYDSLVSAVATFALPEDMSRLKQDLFGPSSTNGSPEAESQVLAALVRAGDDAYDPESLQISERARAMAEDSTEQAALLASSAAVVLSCVSEAAIEGLAAGASDQLVSYLQAEDQLALARLVEYRPELAAQPDLWQEEEGARQLLEAIHARGIPKPRARKRLMPSLLSSRVSGLPELIVNRWGPGAFDLALDALSSLAGDRTVSSSWMRLLTRDATRLSGWLAETSAPIDPQLLAAAAKALDPRNADVQGIGPEKWLPLAESEAVRSGADLTSAVFLLSLGFSNAGPGSDELVRLAFLPVYEGAARSRLTDEWLFLANEVDDSTPREAVSQTRMLERGLVRAILDNHWPSTILVRAATKPDVFERILEAAATNEPGRDLLRDLNAKLLAGEVEASPAQIRRLQKVMTAPEKKKRSANRTQNDRSESRSDGQESARRAKKPRPRQR